MTIWLEGFIFGFIYASLIWAIFVHGVPAARRYQLWNRAHCAALNIVARWHLDNIQHKAWAAAIADQFVRRIDLIGYAEAVKEFERWNKLADDTREVLRSADAEIFMEADEPLPTSLHAASRSPNVVELRRK